MNRSIIHESSTDQSSMNPFETRTWRLQCKTMSGVMLLVIMYFKHLHDNRERVQREMMTCNVHRNRRSTANRSHGIVHANRRCAMRCNAYIDNKKQHEYHSCRIAFTVKRRDIRHATFTGIDLSQQIGPTRSFMQIDGSQHHARED